MSEQHHAAAVGRAIELFKDQPGALLPILHGIQDELGFVPPAAIPGIAQALNLSRAEVHGVVSFYHYFRTTPPGRHTVHVCRAESCQSMGADRLAEHARSRLGAEFHETSKDGRFSLEPIYCLGHCALSPAMMVDGEMHGRVTPERFDEVMAAVKAGAE
jgi:formate dehydrogenase subunit gamma